MSRNAVARWVSIVGHPFTSIVLLLLSPFWKGSEVGALRVTSFIAVGIFIPLGLFMRQRCASGQWATVDASARTDRPVLYLSLFVALLLSSLYFLFIERSAMLVRGSVVFAVMLGVATVLNRRIKLSLHLAFAVFCGLILTRIHLSHGLPILLYTPLLAWSRLALLRHTFPEIMGGFALGLVGAAMMLWL